jgi:pyrophosphatase PpaX
VSASHRAFSTYLFDLDGTLIDSIELIMASFRHTMLAHLGEVPADHDWRSGFGTPLRTQLERFARDAREADAMRSTYGEFNDVHHDRMVEAYPGIRDALEDLRGPNTRLGIVTSKNRRAMRRGLRLCGLDGYFDVCVTVDDVDEFKPHPAPVVEALDQLSADAGETLFIGDSPHDVAAGRAAGVRTAAVLWGPFPREALARQAPDYWLTHPTEISSLPRT